MMVMREEAQDGIEPRDRSLSVFRRSGRGKISKRAEIQLTE